MPLFASKSRVAVNMDDTLPDGDPAQNTVYIKQRMNYRDTAEYQDFLVKGSVVDGEVRTAFHIGTAELELLRINVVGWVGPEFKDEHGRPVPYSPAAIDDIDPQEPFWQKVLGEVNRLNKRGSSDAKKKLSTSDGDERSTASIPEPVEVLTSSSRSRNGTPGRRMKLVN